MNITAPVSPAYGYQDASKSAAEGLRNELVRLERNVAEIASAEGGDNDRIRSLVEQQEIVQNFRANARSLQAASDAVGTILDIKV